MSPAACPTIPRFERARQLGTYGQADGSSPRPTRIADSLRVGASVARLTRDGFGKNLTTGDDNYNKDVLAGRGLGGDRPRRQRSASPERRLHQDKSNPRGGHRLIPSLLTGAPVLDDVYRHARRARRSEAEGRSTGRRRSRPRSRSPKR